MIAQLVTQVPVLAEQVEEVIALHDAVVLHHPEVLFADEGLEDRCGDVRVIVRAEGIADIVQQRANHVLLVLAIFPGQGGGLQRMGQAIDGKAAAVTLQQFQVGNDTVRQIGAIVGPELPADDGPVFGGAIFHVGETRAFVLRHGTFLSCYGEAPLLREGLQAQAS
ncbi:hypothetical protein D3C77_303590 [compost metagenome]